MLKSEIQNQKNSMRIPVCNVPITKIKKSKNSNIRKFDNPKILKLKIKTIRCPSRFVMSP